MEPDGGHPRAASSAAGRLLWAAAGTLFLCLGIAGIVVPLLPTTPFLLLAAACYLRGSPRMHKWMITNKLFGRYLSDYYEGRGMSWRAKGAALSLLWIVIGLSALLATEDAVVRTILVVVAVLVSIHISFMRTKNAAAEAQSGQASSGDTRSP